MTALRHHGKWFAVAVLALTIVLAAVLVYFFSGSGGKPGTAAVTHPPKPHYVGSISCASCHAAEYKAWLGSHHQLAMQPATAGSVLGEFDGVRFSGGDADSRFYRDGDTFMVRTTGPDGKRHDYRILYTFGVDPLQQYLIALPGGRLQAFDIAWDTRPKRAGGQRWFALYPGNNGNPGSPLNWTASDQTWNYMCAACHSTDVEKNYDAKTRAYHTTWSEVSVGCEACHGPGSNHVLWAKKPQAHPEFSKKKGLAFTFAGDKGISWTFDSKDNAVRRSEPRTSHREIETCAFCHSLSQPIHAGGVHGQPVGDNYDVALFTSGNYFPDGQIEGEVYEYGSFLQSRMYQAGVTCSNCHDPHTTKLRASGNRLCTGCHLAKRYDTPRHTHHPAASKGAQCVSCHMPARTYMRVDVRRDHSLRVPRPDLSVELGTPNACNQCHKDKTPQWAARYIEKWFGSVRIGMQQFAAALQAGREESADAGERLVALIRDSRQPAIARATALHLLAVNGYSYPGDIVEKAAGDESALVRSAGAELLGNVSLGLHSQAVAGLLDDPVRAVRIEAADALAGVESSALPASTAKALRKASKEYIAAQTLNADRPEAHLNLATFYARKYQTGRAETELHEALDLDPAFSPAAVNLADLYRSLGRDRKAGSVLHAALERTPNDPVVLYALALLKVRQHKRDEALALLAKTAALAPSNPRYGYVYAIALNDAGKTGMAIQVLERTLEKNPHNRDILIALVDFYTREGNFAKAQEYRQRLNDKLH